MVYEVVAVLCVKWADNLPTMMSICFTRPGSSQFLVLSTLLFCPPPQPQLHPDWPLLVLGWSWDTQRRYLCPGAWAFGGCAGGQATSCAPTQSGSHQCYPSAVVCILKMHLFCFGATEYRKASVTGGQPSQFARSHTGLVLWC